MAVFCSGYCSALHRSFDVLQEKSALLRLNLYGRNRNSVKTWLIKFGCFSSLKHDAESALFTTFICKHIYWALATCWYCSMYWQVKLCFQAALHSREFSVWRIRALESKKWQMSGSLMINIQVFLPSSSCPKPPIIDAVFPQGRMCKL